MAEFQTSDFNELKNLIISRRAVPAPAANGQTILFHAVQRKNDAESCELASLILTYNSPSVAVQVDHLLRQTALFFAARAGNLETCRILIGAGCSPKAKDAMGQVPLFYAAREGHMHIALADEFLQTAELVDINGQTCLFYAAAAGRLEVCRLLIDRFPRLLFQRDFQGCRAAYLARNAGHFEIAELLDQPENDDGRQRYRLVPLKGHLSEEQIASFELQFPDIAVWAARSGPISKKLEVEVTVKSPPHPIKKPQKPADSWETMAKRILSDLSKRPEADIFMRPVDPVKHQCPDYPLVITKPMDFGTITAKLKDNRYDDFRSFRSDVQLVFSNCMTYNAEGTEPRRLCKKTEDWIVPRLMRIEQAPALQATPVAAVSFT